MHQIFKFGPDGGSKPIMQMGEAFVPGGDTDHFCKPTSVAVHSVTKEIFVADGYCNSRLLKFSPSGQISQKWGFSGIMTHTRSPINFKVPHKVILIEDRNQTCISDRENGLIKCLDINREIQDTIVISNPAWDRLFSISYAKCSPVDMIFAVNGPSFSGQPIPVLAFAVSREERKVLTHMSPASGVSLCMIFMSKPHISASSACSSISHMTSLLQKIVKTYTLWRSDQMSCGSS